MICLSSHEDIVYFLNLTTLFLYGERESEEKLCLCELAKVPMEEFFVAIFCYCCRSWLLLLPLTLPLPTSLSIALTMSNKVGQISKKHRYAAQPTYPISDTLRDTIRSGYA